MAPQAYADVAAVQIEAITPLLTGFFDEEQGLYEKFEKIQSKSQSGRSIRMPIEIRPGGSMRAVNIDNGPLGTGTAPKYDYTLMSPVDSVFALSWSLKSKFTTDSDAKAVVDTVQRTIASGIAEAKIHVDKHLNATAAGVLATSTAYSDGGGAGQSVVTCNNALGVRLIRFGDPLSFYTSAAQTTYHGTATVVGIDYQAKTVTLDVQNATSGFVSGDVLCVGGLTATPPTWLYNVSYHHNNSASGYWLSWDRSKYPETRTPTFAGGGNAFTVEAANALLAYLDGELGEDVTTTGNWGWYMNPKTHFSLVQIMTMISEIELSGDNAQVDLAFSRKKQRKLCGFPITTSINADPTRVDFFDYKNWLRGVYKELAFQRLGGSTVLPVPNGTSYDASEISYLLWSQQIAMKNPRRGAYVSNLINAI